MLTVSANQILFVSPPPWGYSSKEEDAAKTAKLKHHRRTYTSMRGRRVEHELGPVLRPIENKGL